MDGLKFLELHQQPESQRGIVATILQLGDDLPLPRNVLLAERYVSLSFGEMLCDGRVVHGAFY
jgi:hypothetical protein